MKQMQWRRVLACMLTLCMLLSMFPVSAFAEEHEEHNHAAEDIASLTEVILADENPDGEEDSAAVEDDVIADDDTTDDAAMTEEDTTDVDSSDEDNDFVEEEDTADQVAVLNEEDDSAQIVEEPQNIEVNLIKNQTKTVEVGASCFGQTVVNNGTETVSVHVAPVTGTAITEKANVATGSYLVYAINTGSTSGRPYLTSVKKSDTRLKRMSEDEVATAGWEKALWKVTVLENGYTLQTAEDQYLNITASGTTITADEQILNFADHNGGILVGQNGTFMNPQNTDEMNVYAPSDDNGSRMNFYPVTGTQVTFAGLEVGQTTVTMGNVTFTVNVTEPAAEETTITIDLTAGDRKTVTLSGNYLGTTPAVTQEGIVDMASTLSASYQAAASSTSTPESGGLYLAVNNRANTNGSSNIALTSGTTTSNGITGLKLAGNTNSFDSSAVWAIMQEGENYYFKTVNGEYLTVANNSSDVISTKTALTLTAHGDYMMIGQDGYYLNQYGGQQNTLVVGYDQTDNGNDFAFFPVTPLDATTTITFTALAVGTTTVTYGNTHYVINVNTTKDITIQQGRTETVDVLGDPEIPENEYVTISKANFEYAKGDTEVTSLAENGKYFIFNIRASKYLANHIVDGGIHEAALGQYDMIDYVWTFAGAGSTRYVKDQNGKSMYFKNATAQLRDEGMDVYYTYHEDEAYWAFHDGSSAYLNDHNGTHGAGWNGASASTDSGSRWKLYPANVTKSRITFTGAKAGTTAVVIGDTTYNITVEGCSHENTTAVSFDWSEDCTSCTATRSCTACGETLGTETVSEENIAAEVTVQPTCSVKGSTTYTATFAAEWAVGEGKTKVLQNIATLDHTFTAEFATCTAEGCSARNPKFIGTPQAQPFSAGTGDSVNFRIPGIVTLSNGRLIAASDARWNHSGDGAGLDTIVSVSEDNGVTWRYTFANYLPDNGDTRNELSTCFIDPAIGTDGQTAYLIADLWPAGIALNTSKYQPVTGDNASGFNADGHLLLRDLAGDTKLIGEDGYNTMAAAREYNYYLNLTNLKIYTAAGEAVEGYTVDAHFNIKGTSVNTNLFCADSPFQPYPTDYLYLTTSDDGFNWSVPKLLNLKNGSEKAFLIGPGNGTYNEAKQHMIFTAYRHDGGGNEDSCLVWKDAEGNWHRSEDCTTATWSSEASAVVLSGDRIRVFYRDGQRALRYTDMVWSEEQGNYVRDTNATEVSTTAVKTTGCQLTAIKYSKQIDGKTAILVATPTANGSRKAGCVYVFLLDENNGMELANNYNVTGGAANHYAYSCLTELSDGNLGLLWESGNATITYTTLKISEVAANAKIGNQRTIYLQGVDPYTEYVPGEMNLEGEDHVGKLHVTTNKINVAKANTGTNSNFDGDAISLSDCLYTFLESGTTDAYYIESTARPGLYLSHKASETALPSCATKVAITVADGQDEGAVALVDKVTDGGAGKTLYFWKTESSGKTFSFDRQSEQDTTNRNTDFLLYRVATTGEATPEIPGFVKITKDQIESGRDYLIVAKAGEEYFALRPSTGTNRYDHVVKINTNADEAVEMTALYVKRVRFGDFTLVDSVSNTTYNFIVTACDEHDYIPANCYDPEVCRYCCETRGEALGHLPNGEYTFNWFADRSVCVAVGTCTRGNCGTIRVRSTNVSQTTTEPTCSEMGKTTYTATFVGTWAEGQVATITEGTVARTDHDYGEVSFNWFADCSGCIAVATCNTCQQVCRVRATEITQTPVAATCSTAEGVEYTATFEGTWAAGKTSTKYLATGAKGDHTYAVTFNWFADRSNCIAVGECSECGIVSRVRATNIATSETPATCSSMGVTTYTATFENTWAAGETATATAATSPKTDHDYGEVSFNWFADCSGCIAVATCNTCQQVCRVRATEITETPVAATCSTAEGVEYTATFEDTWADGESSTKYLATGAKGDHTYAVTFNWFADRSNCIAVGECSECGIVSRVRATNIATSETPATCSSMGVTTYTATFENTWAAGETATATAATSPKTGHDYGEVSFNWFADCSGCIAVATCNTCQQVCRVRATEITETTVEATCSQMGGTSYGATFVGTWAEGETSTAFQATTGRSAHHYGENVSYNWFADRSVCVAIGVCEDCHAVTRVRSTRVEEAYEKEPTCTQTGVKTYTAIFEGLDWAESTVARATVAKLPHADTNGDGLCDNGCNAAMENE